MSKDKQTGVKVQLSGQDGNIFAIMGRVKRAMTKGGFGDDFKKLAEEVRTSGSYSTALGCIADYVEVS